MKGKHKPLLFSGVITKESPEKVRNEGMARASFFPPNPSPFDCFIEFMPLSLIDNIAQWTSTKINKDVNRSDILGIFIIWFISGLVLLPSVELYFQLLLGNILKLVSIEEHCVQYLPKISKYNTLAASLQYNEPTEKAYRRDEDNKQDFLFLI